MLDGILWKLLLLENVCIILDESTIVIFDINNKNGIEKNIWVYERPASQKWSRRTFAPSPQVKISTTF